MLIYQASDRRTDRRATVELLAGAPRHLPYIAAFYEREQVDHTRRFSRAGLAESAADHWCGLDHARHHQSPRAEL